MSLGDEIPSENHVLRFIKNGQRVKVDPYGEYLNNAMAGAFKPVPGDTEISMTWIEHFDCNTFNEKLLKATKAFCMTMRSNFKESSLFAYIKVRELKNICLYYGFDVEVKHWPEGLNDAHSSINFLNFEENSISNQNAMFDCIVKSTNLKYILLENIDPDSTIPRKGVDRQ